EANVAVVSVPGPYAALAAHCALTAGLHVLLFSDNVPVSDEVALKRRASRLGRLVMGLAKENSISAEIVHNGVDAARFRSADPGLAAALRQRAGAGGTAG